MRKRLAVVLALCTMMAAAAGCGNSNGASQSSAAKSDSAADSVSAVSSSVAAVSSAAETSSSAVASVTEACDLEDGTYTADITTDSTMFHINETCDDKGTLTVKDGKMTIHMVLASTGIVKLFVGSAEDAQKDGAAVIDYTSEDVTYDDGMTEEAYAFDVPVPALDTEFAVAILGTKGTWYDHVVTVSNPVKQ